MPYPVVAAAEFSQLGESSQRALIWANACQVIAHEDLMRVVWPRGVQKQVAHRNLTTWLEEGLLVRLKDVAAYRLGPTGGAKLNKAGYEVELMSSDPAERVLAGMLLASRFAASLGADMQDTDGVAAFTWESRPFSGDTARPDGSGSILYTDTAAGPREPAPEDLLDLRLPRGAPTASHWLTWISLEIDSGTETGSQLAARATRWGEMIRRWLQGAREGEAIYVLWLTSGGQDRANTIWTTWLRYAAYPLLVATVEDLTINGHLRPWRATWRDEHGRPRKLNPYDGHEPVWRFEPSPQPKHSCLEDAVHAWESTRGGR